MRRRRDAAGRELTAAWQHPMAESAPAARIADPCPNFDDYAAPLRRPGTPRPDDRRGGLVPRLRPCRVLRPAPVGRLRLTRGDDARLAVRRARCGKAPRDDLLSRVDRTAAPAARARGGEARSRDRRARPRAPSRRRDDAERVPGRSLPGARRDRGRGRSTGDRASRRGVVDPAPGGRGSARARRGGVPVRRLDDAGASARPAFQPSRAPPDRWRRVVPDRGPAALGIGPRRRAPARRRVAVPHPAAAPSREGRARRRAIAASRRSSPFTPGSSTERTRRCRGFRRSSARSTSSACPVCRSGSPGGSRATAASRSRTPSRGSRRHEPPCRVPLPRAALRVDRDGEGFPGLRPRGARRSAH